MANATNTLPLLTASQASKEASANALFSAYSPAGLFGVDPRTTAALTFGYLGGKYRKADGTILSIDDGTLALTASATNYISVTDGVLSVVTVEPASWPGPLGSSARALYEVVCDSSGPTGYTDYRTTGIGSGAAAGAAASDITLADTGGYFTSTNVEGALQELGAGAGGATLADGDYGDITVAGTGTAMAIDNNAVTYAKMQDVSATQRVLGRNTAGAGDPEEVTLSQLLDWIGSAAQGDILYRGSAGWARLAAGTSGQVLETQGSGANPVWVDRPYNPSGFYPGVPSSSAKILRVPVDRSITFAANFASSKGSASAAATGTTNFDIQKNGSTVGTMSFAASATTATFTSSGGASVSFSAGDVLAIIAPGTPDATLADVGFVLQGVQA